MTIDKDGLAAAARALYALEHSCQAPEDMSPPYSPKSKIGLAIAGAEAAITAYLAALPNAGDELVAELLTWLHNRAEPDSGIHYQTNAAHVFSRVELYDDDADFVAKHFHGKGASTMAQAITSLTSRAQAAEAERDRLAADAIVAPAECDEECDDPDCPYQHKPLTLRQAYENAVSRMRDVQERLSAAEASLASARENALEEAAQTVSEYAEEYGDPADTLWELRKAVELIRALKEVR